MGSEFTFQWPEGKRAAVSLSFDDARFSQIEQALPILDAQGVQATFYVSLPNLDRRLEDWRRAVERGHEIGNHTLTHPCSGNFPWSRTNALEEYSLERMEEEILGANNAIQERLGVTPRTFAYPCGQKFVGRGQTLQSYIPLVSRYFTAGRGFRDESPNDPAFCDLAQAMGVDGDTGSFQVLEAWIEMTIKQGGWLILAVHDVGAGGQQTMSREVLEAVCRYGQDASNGLWLDTVASAARYINEWRDGTEIRYGRLF